MNRFTRMKESKELPGRQEYNNTTGKSNNWIWAFMAKIIMIAVLIFGAHCARVVFKAKTESLNKEAVRIERAIDTLKQETMHLRNKKAALSASSYIRKKTRKLGLRGADYRQIQHVALLREPRFAPGSIRMDYAHETSGKENRKNSSYISASVSRNRPGSM